MATYTKVVRIRRDQLRGQLRKLPAIMAGKSPRHQELSRHFQTTLGVEILKKIHSAYLTKSRGDRDDLGNYWKALNAAYARNTNRPRGTPILILTKRLVNSLKPGRFNASQGTYSPPPEQVFEVKSGSVKIGTNVPYAKHVHRVRPLWPVKRYSAPGSNASMRVWLIDILRNLANQFAIRLRDWKVDT